VVACLECKARGKNIWGLQWTPSVHLNKERRKAGRREKGVGKKTVVHKTTGEKEGLDHLKPQW